MSRPRFHILFDFCDGPFGGGNQFLKALREAFRKYALYAEDPSGADVFLYNSHHVPERVWDMRKKYSKAIFIHRMDGPMSKYSRDKDVRDTIAYLLGEFADATVFQSRYSMKANLDQGMILREPYALIGNAPDPDIFYLGEAKKTSGKFSIAATSWSGNINKGFEVYEWLDNNLDFSRYDMTFIGNSPADFKNITLIPPLPSAQLADELRKRHVYITASLSDPCSNALIEALNCGLVPIARNSGGHPEIVRDESLLFDEATEIPGILDRIAAEHERILQRLTVWTIEDIAGQYCDFARYVIQKGRKYLPEKTFKKTVGFLREILGVKEKKRLWKKMFISYNIFPWRNN